MGGLKKAKFKKRDVEELVNLAAFGMQSIRKAGASSNLVIPTSFLTWALVSVISGSKYIKQINR